MNYNILLSRLSKEKTFTKWIKVKEWFQDREYSLTVAGLLQKRVINGISKMIKYYQKLKEKLTIGSSFWDLI